MTSLANADARLNALVMALGYLLLPALPFLLIPSSMNLEVFGPINVECLFIGVLSFYLPRYTTCLLLFLDLTVNMLRIVSKTYMLSLFEMHIDRIGVYSLPAHTLLSLSIMSVLLAAVSAVLAYAFSSPRNRFWPVVYLLLLMTAPLLIDAYDNHLPWSTGNRAKTSYRVGCSPIVEVVRLEKFFQIVRDQSLKSKGLNSPASRIDSASSRVFDLRGHNSEADAPDVVLILVESWGLSLDPKVAAGLTAPYTDPRLAEKYDISQGAVAFNGPTVSGEGRELCQTESGFGLLDITPKQARDCLPDRFHAKGYRTISVHGYKGGLFQRSSWYQTIGFNERWFEPELQQAGLPVCGGRAFPGICDGSIASWLGSAYIDQSSTLPRFIYWVTLNSHLPVPPPPAQMDNNICESILASRDPDSLCSWFLLIINVHRCIQQLALGNLARPTVLIAVGDHVPPFGEERIRKGFSATEVLYVVLRPVSLRSTKSNEGADARLRALR